jgi:asparagine synthase (glutamine-hydrolysing)
MPGLIIIVQKGAENFERNREVIREMTFTIMHEDFYKAQFFELGDMGLHASKVYLDHEYAPKAAASNADQTIFCILSGELYSLDKMRNDILLGGITVNDPQDMSELVLHLYEQKGEKFLDDLNGYFHLLLVDKIKGRILIANDRFGIQRFYYCQPTEDTMIFAPELKCFRKYPDLNISLNPEGLIHYFKYSSPLENCTFYSAVKRVAIASLFTCEHGRWSNREYWAPERMLEQERLSQQAFLESATARFESIIDEYYKQGSTGLSLTGGWDTRAILSVLYRKGIHLPCYTFAGMYQESFDVKLAKNLADRSSNPHFKLILGSDFLRNFEQWANKAIFVSDGLSRILRCHEYYVNIRAREYGTVRLTGKYGSQIIRGITLLKDRSPNLKIFSPAFRADYLATPSPLKPWNRANTIRWELPQLEACTQSQEMAALTFRTPYLDNDFVNLILRAPEMPESSLLSRMIIQRNTPEWASIPTNRGELISKRSYSKLMKGWYTSLNFIDSVYNYEKLPTLALYVTRIGDALGVSPFFNGREQWWHYRLWFARELKNYVQQILLDPATLRRKYWDGNFIEQMLRAHCGWKANYTREIDRILAFELWCRQNNIST